MDRTIAICGNPNSGKTTIFNALTGLNQRVANYPGVTVEKVTGQFTVTDPGPVRLTLADVPGTYSLAAFSPDEYIAATTLFGDGNRQPQPDAVICVIDATNLERGLYLLFKVLEIGCPVVMALNMVDLAERRGMRIDYDKLSRAVGGLAVVPVVGNRGRGIDRLKQATARAVTHNREQPPLRPYDKVTEAALDDLRRLSRKGQRSRAEYLRMIFDVNGPAGAAFVEREGPEAHAALERIRSEIRNAWPSLTAAETTPLTRRAADAVKASVTFDQSPELSRSDKADRLLLHSFLGPVVLMAIMVVVFQSIFSWAQPFMGLIDSVFSGLGSWAGSRMPDGPLRSLITDGVIGGVGSVLLFLPQIAILFMFVAILEDSGYMARGAFLVDRIFRWCGLSGKSFIPMLSSFACAVPGIMATRTIEDRKLRFITILVAPLLTCSARLPVFAVMIAAFVPYRSYLGLFNLQGMVLTLLYVLGVLMAVIVAFVLSRTLLKTKRSTFFMELPSYRIPTVKSVAFRVFHRVRSFVVRAGTVILAITIVIWALSYYPRSSDAETTYARQLAALEAHYDVAAMIAGHSVQRELASVRAEVGDFPGTVTKAYVSVVNPQELELVREALLARFPARREAIESHFVQHRLALERQQAVREVENRRMAQQLRNSYMGRLGRWLEPAFHPLGWDWKITMATLASFPAREVVIATLGTIYNLGARAGSETAPLVEKMRQARWEEGPRTGQPVFTLAVALSIMVFFAVCCQCGATLVTIRQETGDWRYAAFTFGYMTVLAYCLGTVAYQVSAALGL